MLHMGFLEVEGVPNGHLVEIYSDGNQYKITHNCLSILYTFFNKDLLRLS